MDAILWFFGGLSARTSANVRNPLFSSDIPGNLRHHNPELSSNFIGMSSVNAEVVSRLLIFNANPVSG